MGDVYGGVIQANFNDSNVWMNGKITKAQEVKGSENIFTIEYENGHVEENVPESRVREVPLDLNCLQTLLEEIQLAFKKDPQTFMYSRYNITSKAELVHSDIYVPDEAGKASSEISRACNTQSVCKYIYNEVTKSDCCLIAVVRQESPNDSSKKITIPLIINSKTNERPQFTYENEEVVTLDL